MLVLFLFKFLRYININNVGHDEMNNKFNLISDLKLKQELFYVFSNYYFKTTCCIHAKKCL